mgnify:CR=1 FL=1
MAQNSNPNWLENWQPGYRSCSGPSASSHFRIHHSWPPTGIILSISIQKHWRGRATIKYKKQFIVSMENSYAQSTCNVPVRICLQSPDLVIEWLATNNSTFADWKSVNKQIIIGLLYIQCCGPHFDLSKCTSNNRKCLQTSCLLTSY